MISLSGPAWGFGGTAVGAIVAGAAVVIKGRMDAKNAQRLASGTVATADSAVVFDNQMKAFDASERLRHDMAAQIERCQGEIAALKAELNQTHDRYQQRVEALETELAEMAERLREDEDEQRGAQHPDTRRANRGEQPPGR